MNFLFNNGLGPAAGGCNGQSPQNCSVDFSGCCTMPAGPILSYKLNTSSNVSFNPMNISEKVQLIKAQKAPAMLTKASMPLNLPQVRGNSVGVL